MLKLQPATAIKTLTKLHHNLSAELRASEKNSARIRAAIGHVEAVMKLLEPSNPLIKELVNARRRAKVLTFRRGEPVQLTFQILRAASEPLSVREISERMAKLRGKDVTDETGMYHLRHAVRHVLRNYRGKSVAVTEGVWPERWMINRH